MNNGTMELSELIYVNSLTNNGTVNVPESDNVKGAKPVTEYSKWDEKTFGVTTLSNQGTVNIAGQMTSATSGASWTNNAKTQTAAAGVINIADGAALNVQAANTVTNSGKIENNGTIALTAAFTNNGEIAIATATGKISSSKTSTKVTNNGTIALDAPVDVFEVAGKASTTSIVTNGTTGVTSAAIAPADVDDLDDIEEINSIEMSGAWDAESLKGMTDAWDNITMQTWNAATIDLGEVTANQFADVTSVIVKGNSALTNSTETAEELGLAAGATITVEGTLAVDEYVTIGKEIATSPVITVLGSMSNSGEVYATLTIGGGVPVNTTAMYTNERTVLFTGDGSFGMNLNELATVATQNLPIVIILMNNGVLGMVRQWQNLFFDKHYSQTVLERKTDFVKLAEAFGIKGYRISDVSQMKDVIDQAFKEKGPVLVDCYIDKDEFVLPMLPPGGSFEDIITIKEDA